MKKFEYLVQFYSGKMWHEMSRQLDALGKDRWELVSVCADVQGDEGDIGTSGYNCFLKREVAVDVPNRS